MKTTNVSNKNLKIFESWGIDEDILTELVQENGSLRGMLIGYIAEHMFRQLILDHPEIVDLGKDRDHDRKSKGDRNVLYKGHRIRIEVKSLQSKHVKELGDDNWSGRSQVDASDRRIVKFPDGTVLNTTLLLRGEFDILAINCFAFGGKWRFIFARNDDLPTSNFRNYTEEQKKQLLASLIHVTWPPQAPFSSNLIKILEDTIHETHIKEKIVVERPREDIIFISPFLGEKKNVE